MSKRVEEYIEKYTRNGSNEIVGDWYKGEPRCSCVPWLTPDDARVAAEMARDEVIEKVTEWIRINFEEYVDKFEGDDTVYLRVNDFVDDFKKALTEEGYES